jgi:type VI secretion system protein ImpM
VDVGLFGKLPSHGDFLRRRVSDAFVGRWDGWLQQSMAASLSEAGPDWLALYLTSPAWRFVCAPQAVTQHCLAGVMVPSVDRVGRYYPLTVVGELSDWAGYLPGPAAIAVDCADWFLAVEQLAVEALASERLDFELFDAQVADSSRLLESLLVPPAVLLDTQDARNLMEAPRGAWHVPLISTESLPSVVQQLAYAQLSARPGTTPDTTIVWWTDGSALVAPCCLLAKNLPEPGSFTSFLDGQWKTRGAWRSVQAVLTEPEEHSATIVEDTTAGINFVSAGRTDRGIVRETNQDAFLERAESGIWAVADGMGGHEHGELASHMICDGLLNVTPEVTLEATSMAVQRRLADINAQLHRMATREVAPVKSGSTVVVLMARGLHCEVLWAGDSRAYRIRDGKLDALTKDHVWAGPGEAGSEESFTITRAVGGEAQLELDSWRGKIRPGDRFLLCSDGVSRALDEAAILDCVLANDLRGAVTALIEEAIGAGSSDNVTAIIIEAVR